MDDKKPYILWLCTLRVNKRGFSVYTVTVLPAKSDSDVIFCLLSYQGFIMDISLEY